MSFSSPCIQLKSRHVQKIRFVSLPNNECLRNEKRAWILWIVRMIMNLSLHENSHASLFVYILVWKQLKDKETISAQKARKNIPSQFKLPYGFESYIGTYNVSKNRNVVLMQATVVENAKKMKKRRTDKPKVIPNCLAGTLQAIRTQTWWCQWICSPQELEKLKKALPSTDWTKEIKGGKAKEYSWTQNILTLTECLRGHDS